jgi:hypothetical protein
MQMEIRGLILKHIWPAKLSASKSNSRTCSNDMFEEIWGIQNKNSVSIDDAQATLCPFLYL